MSKRNYLRGSNPWNQTADREPPEGVRLIGESSDGTLYRFQSSKLDRNATLYFGGDLNPVPEPIRWRQELAEDRELVYCD